MSPETALFRWDELALDKVTEMVARKTVAGAELSLTQAYFKKGSLIPVHHHDTEILLYVLQGAVRTQTAAGEVTVREGEVLVIAAGVAHQAETLDDTFLLSVTRTLPARPPA